MVPTASARSAAATSARQSSDQRSGVTRSPEELRVEEPRERDRTFAEPHRGPQRERRIQHEHAPTAYGAQPPPRRAGADDRGALGSDEHRIRIAPYDVLEGDRRRRGATGVVHVAPARDVDQLTHEAAAADHDERAVPGGHHDTDARRIAGERAYAVQRVLHGVRDACAARAVAHEAAELARQRIELLDAIDFVGGGDDARLSQPLRGAAIVLR